MNVCMHICHGILSLAATSDFALDQPAHEVEAVPIWLQVDVLRLRSCADDRRPIVSAKVASGVQRRQASRGGVAARCAQRRVERDAPQQAIVWRDALDPQSLVRFHRRQSHLLAPCFHQYTVARSSSESLRMEPSTIVLCFQACEPLVLDELLPLGLKGVHDLGKGAFHRRRGRQRFARACQRRACAQQRV